MSGHSLDSGTGPDIRLSEDHRKGCLSEQGLADARKIPPQVHKTLDGAQICRTTVSNTVLRRGIKINKKLLDKQIKASD